MFLAICVNRKYAVLKVANRSAGRGARRPNHDTSDDVSAWHLIAPELAHRSSKPAAG
jgi:hypothetical protein